MPPCWGFRVPSSRSGLVQRLLPAHESTQRREHSSELLGAATARLWGSVGYFGRPFTLLRAVLAREHTTCGVK
jgi:hypothetical protein